MTRSGSGPVPSACQKSTSIPRGAEKVEPGSRDAPACQHGQLLLRVRPHGGRASCGLPRQGSRAARGIRIGGPQGSHRGRGLARKAAAKRRRRAGALVPAEGEVAATPPLIAQGVDHLEAAAQPPAGPAEDPSYQGGMRRRQHLEVEAVIRKPVEPVRQAVRDEAGRVLALPGVGVERMRVLDMEPHARRYSIYPRPRSRSSSSAESALPAGAAATCTAPASRYSGGRASRSARSSASSMTRPSSSIGTASPRR